MTRQIAILGLISIVSACNTEQAIDTDDDPIDEIVYEETSYIDEGHVCFGTGNADTAGSDTILITVTIPGECSEGGCATNFEGSCSATVEGDTIDLLSDLSWDIAVELPDDVACTEQCGLPIATCEIDALPDGIYTVNYGGQEMTVTVPSATDACAF